MFHRKRPFGIEKFEPPNKGHLPLGDQPWPQIMFDTKLGKKLKKRGESVNFDTQAYAENLSGRGLSSEAIHDTTLSFRSCSRLSGKGGGYLKSRYKNGPRANVYISSGKDVEKINGTVTHETEHRVQDNAGRLTKLHSARLKARNALSIWASEAAFVGSLSASLNFSAPEEAPLDMKTSVVTLLGSLAIGVATWLDYRYSKIEREAFAAQKNPLPLVELMPIQEMPTAQNSPVIGHMAGQFS